MIIQKKIFFFFVTRPQGQLFRKNQVALEHLTGLPKRVNFNSNSISASRTRDRRVQNFRQKMTFSRGRRGPGAEIIANNDR